MKRLGLAMAILAGATASGCAMCCTPWDEAYTGYGGRWQRTNRFQGRVGSIIAPAGPVGAGPVGGAIYEDSLPPGAILTDSVMSGPVINGPVYGQPTPAPMMMTPPTPATTPGGPTGSGLTPTPATSPFQADPAGESLPAPAGSRSAARYQSYYR